MPSANITRSWEQASDRFFVGNHARHLERDALVVTRARCGATGDSDRVLVKLFQANQQLSLIHI